MDVSGQPPSSGPARIGERATLPVFLDLEGKPAEDDVDVPGLHHAGTGSANLFAGHSYRGGVPLSCAPLQARS
jgi:hypothetical protein